MPDSHIKYLLAWENEQEFPDEFLYQVHGSMAVTGLKRWDLLLYSPGDAPLLIEVHRDAFTDQLERGLIELVAEKARIETQLHKIWERKYKA